LNEAIWTVIMLAIATLLGVSMIFLRKEVAYPLVSVWAFVGMGSNTARRPAWRIQS
jgi:hypothetical protein